MAWGLVGSIRGPAGPTGPTGNTGPAGVDANASVKPFPPVALTDAATIAINAALGTHFRVATTAARTLGIPSNPTDGQVIVIEHAVTGGTARLLTLTTGAAGAFKYGTDITALTATTSGTTDLVQAVYNLASQRWWVTGYVKGF